MTLSEKMSSKAKNVYISASVRLPQNWKGNFLKLTFRFPSKMKLLTKDCYQGKNNPEQSAKNVASVAQTFNFIVNNRYYFNMVNTGSFWGVVGLDSIWIRIMASYIHRSQGILKLVSTNQFETVKLYKETYLMHYFHRSRIIPMLQIHISIETEIFGAGHLGQQLHEQLEAAQINVGNTGIISSSTRIRLKKQNNGK